MRLIKPFLYTFSRDMYFLAESGVSEHLFFLAGRFFLYLLSAYLQCFFPSGHFPYHLAGRTHFIVGPFDHSHRTRSVRAVVARPDGIGIVEREACHLTAGIEAHHLLMPACCGLAAIQYCPVFVTFRIIATEYPCHRTAAVPPVGGKVFIPEP